MNADQIMRASPVMAVVVVESAKAGVELARALVAGGCPLVEVTLRTPAALDAIRAIAAEAPDAIVGAGTVLNASDLEAVIKAGAKFAISPGLTPHLLSAGSHSPIPFIPGSGGASDVMLGLEHGYSRFKLFPASVVGGASMLKALSGPFPDVVFCPTGGVNMANARDFLSLPNVACVGGSWLAPKELVEAEHWSDITELAREAAALAAPV